MTIVWCILALYATGLVSLGGWMAWVFLVLDKRPVIQSEDEVILPHPRQRSN